MVDQSLGQRVKRRGPSSRGQGPEPGFHARVEGRREPGSLGAHPARTPRRPRPGRHGRPPAVLRQLLRQGASRTDRIGFRPQPPYGPGRHLDRRRFDASLREAARDAGVRHRPGNVTRVTRTGNHWRATVSGADGTASYVVDATGGACPARPPGRRTAGAHRPPRGHHGSLPNTGQGGDGSGTFEDGTEHTSLSESTPFGWWYTVPLPSGERIVMAVTDADLVGRAGLRTPDGWWAALGLSRHIGARLPVQARPPELLAVLRAGTSRALPAVGPGWAATRTRSAATPVSSPGFIPSSCTPARPATGPNADGTPRSGSAAGPRTTRPCRRRPPGTG